MIRKLIASLLPCLIALSSMGSIENWLPVEREVGELVASKDVTIVHFWAPWCGNCSAEKKDGGWTNFIASNPGVKFVFVETWNDGKDSREALAKYNLGAQANLTMLAHPGSRRGDGRMKSFMDLPVTWLPTTWIWRDGAMRFAFNYGEIRFPILQQLVDDTSDSW